jgi:hypothetical protein
MRCILFAVILCLLLAPSMKVCAVGLPPGTEIQLQATGQYTNVLDENQTATPATIVLTVVQAAGVTIDWDVASDTIAAGAYAYFPMTITNSGNGTDNITLSATSASGWDVDFIYDEANYGVHDDSETWIITETSPMISDGYCPCFLRILIPDGATEPDTVTVNAISTFDPAQGSASAEIEVPKPGMNATRLTASASPDAPYVGQDITVSGHLRPAISRQVSISLTNPDGNVSSSSTTTAPDGSFETAFNAALVGDYSVAIAFDGDDIYNACHTTLSITSQERLPSLIDLACSPASPVVGDSITITGTLTPALQAAAVDLTCTMPSGSSTQHHLTTADDGTFTWNTTLETVGQWYFQATYAGNVSHSASTRLLAVQATVPTHTVSIDSGPSASPSAIDSQGSVQCSASAVDSLDHQVYYHWSDGNAGGGFAPSSDVRLPVYTAPANDTGQNMVITLTCTATCASDSQIVDTETTQLTVYAVDTSAPQVISVTPVNGAQCVGLSANVVVKFSKAMDHASTEAAVNLTPALDALEYTWSADSKTLTISHANLTPGIDYVGAVTTAAIGANSVAMEQEYTWVFATTSGAWFDPNEIIVETDTEFITPRLVLFASQATTFTAFIGVPEGIDFDTTTSGDGLLCVEAGADVTSLSSSWDPILREFSITAQVASANVSAEILKGITLIAPAGASSAQITIDGCAALDITFAGPLPGDFNGDRAVDISDASAFIAEWIRWHGATLPTWSDATDAIFDLAPHTDGVWPNWTPVGDQCIDILDATAFVDCWVGSHVSSGMGSAAYDPARSSRSYQWTAAGTNDIVVTVDDAPMGMFEVEVPLPSNVRFYSVMDEYGNLRNVIRDAGTGGLLFSEYDPENRAVRIAGSVYGVPPYRVAVIRLGR